MREIKKLVFYSCGNNGDIHYSKNFVKDIANRIPVQTEYHIKCHPSILKDLQMTIKPFNYPDFVQHELVYVEDEKSLLVNTWIGSSNAKFILNEIGCSLTANYEKYKNIYKYLGLEINEPSTYVPEIDWNICDKQGVDYFIKNNPYKKYVIICNGPVMSGQSLNFDLNPIVQQLAVSNPDICFFMSNPDNKIYAANIHYTSDIIKTNGSDLNEIGYIGTKCNLIVGRASGPFCFCHNKTNLFDATKTFLAVTNYKTDGWWALPEQLPTNQAIQLWTNKFDNDSLYDIINGELKK